MKIILRNRVYIQKKDLLFLLKNHSQQQIPKCVIDKCSVSNFKFVKDNDFVFFDEPVAISFFRQWIYCADYLELERYTDDELYEKAARILNQRNDMAKVYNALPDSQKNDKSPLVGICETLTFQMDSICDVLTYRQKLLGTKLPDMIEQHINSEKNKRGFF